MQPAKAEHAEAEEGLYENVEMKEQIDVPDGVAGRVQKKRAGGKAELFREVGWGNIIRGIKLIICLVLVSLLIKLSVYLTDHSPEAEARPALALSDTLEEQRIAEGAETRIPSKRQLDYIQSLLLRLLVLRQQPYQFARFAPVVGVEEEYEKHPARAFRGSDYSTSAESPDRWSTRWGEGELAEGIVAGSKGNSSRSNSSSWSSIGSLRRYIQIPQTRVPTVDLIDSTEGRERKESQVSHEPR